MGFLTKDFYRFWLQSIDSFCDTKSPVIVVGTHAEGKSEQVHFVKCRFVYVQNVGYNSMYKIAWPYFYIYKIAYIPKK